jgi:hypothetical protein
MTIRQYRMQKTTVQYAVYIALVKILLSYVCPLVFNYFVEVSELLR